MKQKEWTPEQIKTFRKGLNLLQRDFALLLRVTREYVVHLERGDRTPSDTMRALLDCLEQKENEKGKEKMKHGKRNL